ncbi:MAG: hypothetical protein IPL73_23290 [Candidatus Obscuribacter sp.]|nr:hypothetical protein [Candidatus Obscuribacter sp.]
MSNKILICVSNTGGGHHSAANALKAAIEELTAKQHAANPYQVVIADVIEHTNPIHTFFVFLYNFLLRHKQSWMKYYIALIEQFKPDNSSIGYWLASGAVKRLLVKTDPALVVSVHPMTNHYLARAMQAVNLTHKPDLMVVVVDPNANLWTGWACKGAALTVAPNILAQERLEQLGVDVNKIVTIGMPVDPRFLHAPTQSRESLLTELGVSPDLLTICLSAGWAGGGSIAKIYQALGDVRKAIQVLVVCGKNEELFEEIQLLSTQMPFATKVLPELPSLSDAMSACDLLVTKAGGLTTFEAVARRLPMAIDQLTEPMPQEAGTAQMLIETNLARPINHPYDIVAIVETLEHQVNRESLPLPTKYNLNRTEAVYEIAEIILSMCQKNTQTKMLMEA